LIKTEKNSLLKMSLKKQAIKAYKKSLELDSTNKNAKEVLSKLKTCIKK